MLVLQIVVLIASIKLLELIKHARLENGISATLQLLPWPCHVTGKGVLVSSCYSLLIISNLAISNFIISNLSKRNKNKTKIDSSFSKCNKKSELRGHVSHKC